MAAPEPRLGCVGYLNARPLIEGWEGPVAFDHPAALCRKLAQGELDVALVSSFEFLRNPIYRVVDSVAIAADGPVESVFVLSDDPLERLHTIELDPASLTSVNLLSCLLAGCGLSGIELKSPERHPEEALPAGTGRLFIGDQALRARRRGAAAHYWDLGKAWRDLTGLPFVFALWLVRPEWKEPAGVAERLRAVKAANMKRLPELARTQDLLAPSLCETYWRDRLRFEFADREKEGLRVFEKRCAELGLLEKKQRELHLV